MFHYYILTVADIDEFDLFYETTVTSPVRDRISAVSMERCAQLCLQTTHFECLSFVHDNSTCYLFDVAVEYGVNTLSNTATNLFKRILGMVLFIFVGTFSLRLNTDPSQMYKEMTAHMKEGRKCLI